MIGIAVTGASGRMGRTNIKVICEDRESSLTGAVDVRGSPCIGTDAGELAGIGRKLNVTVTDDVEEALKNSDVLIDFSVESAAKVNIEASVRLQKAIVIGTTGLKSEDMKLLEKAGETVPVIWAPNFSAGVTLLSAIARISAEVLGAGFDAEIIEIHHRNKKDSPSGTALKFLNILRDVYKTDNVVYGREGLTGERPSGQIGVFAVRGGDVIGEHTIGFFGDGERIELSHKVSSRETFARGALRAAKFITGKGPGLYTVEEVLGLSREGIR